MIFITNKRIIAQQAAEIRLLASQIEIQRSQIDALTQELQRTRSAADRQAIQLNQRAETDCVIRRDLIHVIGKMVAASSSSGYLTVPDVPQEVLPEVIMHGSLALQNRGIEPKAVVLSLDHILRLKMENPSNFEVTDPAEGMGEYRIFGLPVVQK